MPATHAIDPERWQRLMPLLDEALDLPPEARPAFLNAADPALRPDLEALLAADEEAGDFLDDSAADWASTLIEELERATAEPTLDAGALVGPYRVVRTLGQGGMGTVYLADRADGQFEQRVALKLIRPGMGRHEILRRFLQERQILARLQHPNIARLLDGGTALRALVEADLVAVRVLNAGEAAGLRVVPFFVLFDLDALRLENRPLPGLLRCLPQNLRQDVDQGPRLFREDGVTAALQRDGGKFPPCLRQQFALHPLRLQPPR